MSGPHASQHVFERSAGAATKPLPRGYRPRGPQATAFYRVIADHLETIRRAACQARCPVFLLVVAPEPATARWAQRTIELGQPGFALRPVVIDYRAIPRVGAASSPDEARAALDQILAQAR